MVDFFEKMAGLELTFWIIALIGSFIFLIITVVTFLGGDLDSDFDTDVDFDGDVDGGAGFQFFTFKNLVAFLTLFGWTGIACYNAGYSTGICILWATIAGLVMMMITSAMFYYMGKLGQSGTLKIQNAVGAVGEVYLRLKAERGNIGKVHVKVQGSLREMEALTDENIDLEVGTVIKVIGLINEDVLIVEKA